jgi:hypothetical protein
VLVGAAVLTLTGGIDTPAGPGLGRVSWIRVVR